MKTKALKTRIKELEEEVRNAPTDFAESVLSNTLQKLKNQLPKPRKVHPVHPDTKRLQTLIEIFEQGNDTDFEQNIFFAHKKRKTALGAYRLALDEYKKSHDLSE